MNETDFIILNLINSLSTSRIASYLINKNEYDTSHLQLEILSSSLNFRNPGKINTTHVYYTNIYDEKTFIEFMIIDEKSIDRINKWKNNIVANTNYILLFIGLKVNNKSYKKINELIFDVFDTNFENKNFKFINGDEGVLFYSNNEFSKIIEETKPKRNKVSLPRGTYTKTLQKIKHWLEIKGEITFHELMQKFEEEIRSELILLKKTDETIDVESELKIFRQEYETGAKRSQLLLHTVNEQNRVYFRNLVTSKFDLFCYTDNNPRLLHRKVKAFNPYDIYNEEVDVYFEKGTEPIKVKDFNSRYLK